MRQSRANRVLGMTGTQLGILFFIAIVGCGIMFIGLILIMTTWNTNGFTPIPNPFLPTSTSTPSPTFTPSPSPTATNTPSPTPIPTNTLIPNGQLPQIDSLETLDYYRLEAKVSMGSDTSEFSEFSDFGELITVEWDKQSQATRTSMSITGTEMDEFSEAQAMMQTITIGNTVWMNMGGEWTQVTYGFTPNNGSNLDMSDQTEFFESAIFVGQEIVNGIACNHYTFDTNLMEISQPETDTFSAHTNGDLWLANQADLPTVIIKLSLNMQYQGDLFSAFLPLEADIPTPEVPFEETDAFTFEDFSFQIEYDVMDINVPVVIAPPY